MKSELEQLREQLAESALECWELSAKLEAKEEELQNLNESYASLSNDLENERAKLGDSLREALGPFAARLAVSGEIHPVPHARYRWIEDQLRQAGCE